MSFFVLLKGSVVFFFWDEFLKMIFLILVELTNISSRERIHIPPWFLRSHLFFQTSFQGDSFWRISSTIKGTASIPLRFIDFLIEAAMAHSIPLPAVSQGFDGSYSCLRVKLIGWNCLGTENRCFFYWIHQYYSHLPIFVYKYPTKSRINVHPFLKVCPLFLSWKNQKIIQKNTYSHIHYFHSQRFAPTFGVKIFWETILVFPFFPES